MNDELRRKLNNAWKMSNNGGAIREVNVDGFNFRKKLEVIKIISDMVSGLWINDPRGSVWGVRGVCID